VQLIQIDPLDAERAAAGLARGAQVGRASVRDPGSLRARQTALGGDDDARAIAAPCCERARNEPFVVADIVRVPAVRVGGVEQRDAAVERGVQHVDRARLVPVAFRRKAHAAHADHGAASLPHVALSVSDSVRLQPNRRSAKASAERIALISTMHRVASSSRRSAKTPSRYECLVSGCPACADRTLPRFATAAQ
jgi:hypothetical protein